MRSNGLVGGLLVVLVGLTSGACVTDDATGSAAAALDFGGGGFGPGGSDAGTACPAYCYCAGLECPFAGAPECQNCSPGEDSGDAGIDSGTSPPGDEGGGIHIDTYSSDGGTPSGLSPACRNANSDPTSCQDCCDQLAGAGGPLAPGFMNCCYSACAGGDGVQGIAECLPDDICDYLGLLPGLLGEFLDLVCHGIGIIEDGTAPLPKVVSAVGPTAGATTTALPPKR